MHKPKNYRWILAFDSFDVLNLRKFVSDDEDFVIKCTSPYSTQLNECYNSLKSYYISKEKDKERPCYADFVYRYLNLIKLQIGKIYYDKSSNFLKYNNTRKVISFLLKSIHIKMQFKATPEYKLMTALFRRKPSDKDIIIKESSK